MDERFPLPDYVNWPIFPFEGDLRVKQPLPPMESDIARGGEADRPCFTCGRDESDFLWVDDHWLLSPLKRSALRCGVMLHTREHLDMHELSDERAAELGQLIVRIERALTGVGNVGRVHLNRWGDGGAHFHMWFMARPVGVFEMYGYGLPLWYQILPPTPEDEWDANVAKVGQALAQTGGRFVGIGRKI